MRRRCRSCHCRTATDAAVPGSAPMTAMYDAGMLRSQEAVRVRTARPLAGICATAAAALSIALYAWLSAAAFVPIASGGAIEYVFISATARSFLLIAVSAGAAL